MDAIKGLYYLDQFYWIMSLGIREMYGGLDEFASSYDRGTYIEHCFAWNEI